MRFEFGGHQVYPRPTCEWSGYTPWYSRYRNSCWCRCSQLSCVMSPVTPTAPPLRITHLVRVACRCLDSAHLPPPPPFENTPGIMLVHSVLHGSIAPQSWRNAHLRKRRILAVTWSRGDGEPSLFRQMHRSRTGQYVQNRSCHGLTHYKCGADSTFHVRFVLLCQYRQPPTLQRGVGKPSHLVACQSIPEKLPRAHTHVRARFFVCFFAIWRSYSYMVPLVL